MESGSSLRSTWAAGFASAGSAEGGVRERVLHHALSISPGSMPMTFMPRFEQRVACAAGRAADLEHGVPGHEERQASGGPPRA